MRNKDESRIKKVLILSPILMLPLFLIFLELVSFIRFGLKESISGFSEAFLFYTPFVLGFGYAYVILVFCIIWTLKSKGLIKESQPIK